MNLKIDETQIFGFLGPSSIIYHQKKWVLSFRTNRFESHLSSISFCSETPSKWGISRPLCRKVREQQI